MRPHQETWTTSLEKLAGYDCMSDAHVVRDQRGARVFDLDDRDGFDERAKLAAQAPAMARLLLEMLAIIDETRLSEDLEREVTAVLRAAGVLE